MPASVTVDPANAALFGMASHANFVSVCSAQATELQCLFRLRKGMLIYLKKVTIAALVHYSRACQGFQARHWGAFPITPFNDWITKGEQQSSQV